MSGGSGIEPSTNPNRVRHCLCPPNCVRSNRAVQRRRASALSNRRHPIKDWTQSRLPRRLSCGGRRPPSHPNPINDLRSNESPTDLAPQSLPSNRTQRVRQNGLLQKLHRRENLVPRFLKRHFQAPRLTFGNRCSLTYRIVLPTASEPFY